MLYLRTVCFILVSFIFASICSIYSETKTFYPRSSLEIQAANLTINITKKGRCFPSVSYNLFSETTRQRNGKFLEMSENVTKTQDLLRNLSSTNDNMCLAPIVGLQQSYHITINLLAFHTPIQFNRPIHSLHCDL